MPEWQWFDCPFGQQDMAKEAAEKGVSVKVISRVRLSAKDKSLRGTRNKGVL
jgi:hypothetical protein